MLFCVPASLGLSLGTDFPDPPDPEGFRGSMASRRGSSLLWPPVRLVEESIGADNPEDLPEKPAPRGGASIMTWGASAGGARLFMMLLASVGEEPGRLVSIVDLDPEPIGCWASSKEGTTFVIEELP